MAQTVRRTEDFIFKRGRSGINSTNADDLLSYTYRGPLDGKAHVKSKSKPLQHEIPDNTQYSTRSYWVNSHAQTSQNFQSTPKSLVGRKKESSMETTGTVNRDGMRTGINIPNQDAIKIETFSGVSGGGSTGLFTQHLKQTQFLSTANSSSLPTMRSTGQQPKKEVQPQDDGISALYNVEQWMEMKKMRTFCVVTLRQSYEDRRHLVACQEEQPSETQTEPRPCRDPETERTDDGLDPQTQRQN